MVAGQFANIPDWLQQKVLSAAAKLEPSNRDSIYFEAALYTIGFYLNRDASRDEDPFFRVDPRKPRSDPVGHATVNRITLIGETIFLLRSTPAFPEFCRRLSNTKRPVQAAYFEMHTALDFYEAGFELLATTETGEIGADFDFVAKKDGEHINVEVTAFTADEFSVETVANALQRKRKQLPNSAPAVICCVVPEGWLTPTQVWNTEIPNIIARFFKGTKRINAVRLLTERNIQIGDTNGGGLLLIQSAYKNPRARFPTALLDFLFESMAFPSLEIASMAHELSAGIGIDDKIAKTNTSDFFKWVDSLMPVLSRNNES